VCVVALPSCRVAPSVRPAPTTVTPAIDPAIPPSPIGVIAVAIVPIAPGGAAIDIEDAGAAVAACEAAGWPATLPVERARAVAEHGIGSHATVVHPGGITTVTVAAIDCEAPGDIEGPVASLVLDAPAPEGPPDSRDPTAPRDGPPGRPHLAIVGASVAATARLVDPVPLDLAAAPAVRDALARYAADVAEERRHACEDRETTEGVPSEAAIARAIPEAVATAVVHPIRAGAQTLHFAVVQHPTIGFGCQGQEEQLGVLLDPKGEVLLELVSNNGIDLQWITDLDGDGTEEALVDMQWMEDGMHDIGLVHGEAATWERTIVWSADTP